MKLLCIAAALIGQFEIQELPETKPASSFVELELTETPVDNRPTFELLTANWCGGCQSVKQTLKEASHRPFKYRERNVDTEGRLNATSIPAFAYEGKVFQYGFSTFPELMENFAKTTRARSSTAAVQRLTSAQLKQFAHNYRGPLRGVKGNNFYRHLQDANHGFTKDQLAGLTQRDCEMIHGGHHYGYLTPFKINAH